MKTLRTAIVAATLMSSASAMAEVSGNVAVGSDYFFRGFDQSMGFALSGGFDVDLGSGLYAGTWGSSVDDFTSTGGLELDHYIGYGGSFSDDVSFDIGYMLYLPQRYTVQLRRSVWQCIFRDVTLGFATSDDWYGGSGSYDYLYADYSMALNDAYSLGFHYGVHSGAGDYDDYSISLH